MFNFLLLIVDVWVLAALVFWLHYLRPHYGLAPLLFLVGTLTAMLQNQLGIYIEPYPDLWMFLGSNVLVPVIVMTVLVLYVADGTRTARLTIYGVVGVVALMLIIQTVYRLHLSLPDSGTLSGLTRDVLLPPLNPRNTLASLVAFACDMVVIAVFFQGLKNNSPQMPEWLMVGLSLMVALWVDAIVFRLIVDFGTEFFASLLPGDVIGKTISAFILWFPTAYYLQQIAPRTSEYQGTENRPTFDLLFGSFEDIKAILTQTQEALKQSVADRKKEEEYFRQISENINEALWLISPNQLHPFYVNSAYGRIWGLTVERILKDPNAWVNSIYPEDRERILSGLSRLGQGDYDVQYRIHLPDSTVRWVRDRAFPIRNESGDVYRIAGITEDITERQEMEKQRLELSLERERVKLLRDFVSEASHDLKTPLTAINLKIYHLSRSQDPEHRQRHLTELGLLSERMGKMINDMLTLARLENVSELELVRLDIKKLIQDICSLIEPQIQEKNLKLLCHAPDDKPFLRADTDDLSRALMNLMENAIRYTPSGGEVKVHAEVDAYELKIQVMDTGIGISDQEKAHIFERFFRSEKAQAADPAGTGLGLALVKRVVEHHHGKIDVSSAQDVGTTFTIHLPLAG